MNTLASTNVRPAAGFTINQATIPPLLDGDGVRQYLAPLSRSLLYQLDSRGEIQSASLGLKRGSRVYVTSSIVAWLEWRMAATKKPKLSSRARRRAATSTTA
jgi:hypothetical protein